MSQIETPITAFGYTAQTNDGMPVSGTIDASAVDDAGRKLLANPVMEYFEISVN